MTLASDDPGRGGIPATAAVSEDTARTENAPPTGTAGQQGTGSRLGSAGQPEGPDAAPAGSSVPLMAWLRAGAGPTSTAATGEGATAGHSDIAGEDTPGGTAWPAGQPEAMIPVSEPDPVREPDPVPESDPVREPDQVREAQPAAEAGPAGEAGPVSQADSAGEAYQASDRAVAVDEADVLAETRDDMAAGGPLADPGRARIINAAAGFAPDDQWTEILTMFVDDPRGSVLEAAALVDEAIGAFLARVREQQESLASSWEAGGTGTEELRVALQRYRKFWASLADLRQSA